MNSPIVPGRVSNQFNAKHESSKNPGWLVAILRPWRDLRIYVLQMTASQLSLTTFSMYTPSSCM